MEVSHQSDLLKLRVLVALNILSSIFHYVDNVVFFHDYPEPEWLEPGVVDLFWFLMTPFALVGYLQVVRGRYMSGYACLTLYSLMSLLVLGHYNYAPIHEISLKINAFILIEACLALLLLLFVFVHSRRQTSLVLILPARTPGFSPRNRSKSALK